MDGPAPAWHGGSTFALPGDAESAVLVGRVWDPAVNGPSPVVVRDGEVLDVSATFPTVRDLCELRRPRGRGPRRGGPPSRLARRAGGGHRRRRPRATAAAGTDRPAGAQGRRRHVRGVDAGTRDRGAGQGRPRGGRARSGAGSATSSAPTCAPVRPGRPRPPTSRSCWSRGVCGASTWRWASARTRRSSPRPRCCPPSARPSHVGVLAELELEQPRARGRRWSCTSDRPRRRGHPRQRRQPARRRGPLAPCCCRGQGQQRLLRRRPVHPAVRRRLRPRRRPRARRLARGRGPGRVPCWRRPRR